MSWDRVCPKPLRVEDNVASPKGQELYDRLGALSDDLLMEEKLRNLEALAKIKNQIERNKLDVARHGDLCKDPDWWRRVQTARKLGAITDQIINKVLTDRRAARRVVQRDGQAAINARKKKVPTFSVCFMVVAEGALSADLFARLKAEADEMHERRLADAKLEEGGGT